ncbi:MAG: type II/IV secretion system protein [Acidimicrobiales bacterium]
MGDADAMRTIAGELDLDWVDLDEYPVDVGAAAMLSEEIALRCDVVPVGRKFGAPVLAVSNPADSASMDEIKAALGRDFIAVVAEQSQVAEYRGRLYAALTAGIAAQEAEAQVKERQREDDAALEPGVGFAFDGAPSMAHDGSGAVAEMDDLIAGWPPLARVLVSAGRVSRAEMAAAVDEAAHGGDILANVLRTKGLASEGDLFWAMAQEVGLEFVDLDTYPIDYATGFLIPETTARHHLVLPIGKEHGSPVVAMANPADVFAMDDLRTVLGRNFIPVVAVKSQIEAEIDAVFRRGHDAEELAMTAAATGNALDLPEESVDQESMDLSSLDAVVEDAPIVRYVNLIILQALNERASDIHIEPTEKNLRIRFRIDGVLHDMSTAPRSIAGAVATRLKVMGDMDVSEHRLPQEGRTSLTIGNRQIDFRMATMPTVNGEKVVMRLLDKSSGLIHLDQLGFQPNMLERYASQYSVPYGTILVVGPTGCGKTTTLYATLDLLNSSERNLITIEDPVEYQVRGVNQLQLNRKAGLTFAGALRSLLRSDPDVVLIGEIRDVETAVVAVEAALTGHLVLSTLHTKEAAGTPLRLVEMGVEPYLVTSAINCILAQRLARRLCTHCRQPYEPTEAELVAAGWEEEELASLATLPQLYRAVGCQTCANTGYHGRLAVGEMMALTDEISLLIVERASTKDVRKVAIDQGMVTLRQDGLRHVLEGATTLEEILRVVA